MGKLGKDTAAYSNKLNYINEYNKDKYDTISIRTPKGMKEIYKEYADSKNMSLAGLVIQAVNEYISKNQ